MHVPVDTAAWRCPRLDDSRLALFRSTIPVPAADVKDKDGRPHLSKHAWRRWTNAYARGEQQRNALGLQIADEHERCRNPSSPAATTAPVGTGQPKSPTNNAPHAPSNPRHVASL